MARYLVRYPYRAAAVGAAAIAAAVSFATANALAGNYAKLADGLATYSFEQCSRPEIPTLALDPSIRGAAAVAAHNLAVRRYNAHVDASNAYLECITREAEEDMKAYYRTVSDALEAEQNSVLDSLRLMRAEFQPRP